MQTTIQKWGNSLAVRIPISYVKETGINNGSSIEISVKNGIITIKPVKKYVLSELLKRMNKSNIHKEVQTGKPRGKEIW